MARRTGLKRASERCAMSGCDSPFVEQRQSRAFMRSSMYPTELRNRVDLFGDSVPAPSTFADPHVVDVSMGVEDHRPVEARRSPREARLVRRRRRLSATRSARRTTIDPATSPASSRLTLKFHGETIRNRSAMIGVGRMPSPGGGVGRTYGRSNGAARQRRPASRAERWEMLGVGRC